MPAFIGHYRYLYIFLHRHTIGVYNMHVCGDPLAPRAFPYLYWVVQYTVMITNPPLLNGPMSRKYDISYGFKSSSNLPCLLPLLIKISCCYRLYLVSVSLRINPADRGDQVPFSPNCIVNSRQHARSCPM